MPRLSHDGSDRQRGAFHGMDLEGFERKLIVSRNKNHCGHLVARNFREHLEAIEFRHLHVEEDKVGCGAPNGRHGRSAIAAFAEQFEVGLLFQETTKALARQRFIIDDQDTGFHNCGKETEILESAQAR